MKLSELYSQAVGDVTTDPEMTDTFLSWFFKAGDVVGLRDRKGMSWGTVALERDVLRKGLAEVLQSLQETETEAYFCVSPLKAQRAYSREGIKKGENKPNRVLYADIDVKPGSFETTEAALAWLETLAVAPGCVVESGSGGLHAYWASALPLSEEKWWAYLTSTLPEGVAVDREQEVLDRMLLAPAPSLAMGGGQRIGPHLVCAASCCGVIG